MGGAPPLGDCPDDERLPTLHIASGKDTRDTRLPVGVGPNVAPIREPYAELLEHPGTLGTAETHRQQNQIGVHRELAAGDLREGHAAVADGPLDLDAMQLSDVTRVVT